VFKNDRGGKSNWGNRAQVHWLAGSRDWLTAIRSVEILCLHTSYFTWSGTMSRHKTFTLQTATNYSSLQEHLRWNSRKFIISTILHGGSEKCKPINCCIMHVGLLLCLHIIIFQMYIAKTEFIHLLNINAGRRMVPCVLYERKNDTTRKTFEMCFGHSLQTSKHLPQPWATRNIDARRNSFQYTNRSLFPQEFVFLCSSPMQAIQSCMLS
jgi:hypothetical protein